MVSLRALWVDKSTGRSQGSESVLKVVPGMGRTSRSLPRCAPRQYRCRESTRPGTWPAAGLDTSTRPPLLEHEPPADSSGQDRRTLSTESKKRAGPNGPALLRRAELLVPSYFVLKYAEMVVTLSADPMVAT